MSETLKPCPFCGKIPEIDKNGFVWHVKGSKPLCLFGTYGVHATAWNRRASGWISVKDRLPEKTGRYIVHQWRTGETSDCDYYHRDDPYTTFTGWEYEHEKISHWMPLPPAPEVEE